MELKQIAKIATLSKKEINKTAADYVAAVLEDKSPEEILFESVRFEEFFGTINKALKAELKENSTYNGAKFTEQNRTTLDYSVDSVWFELNKQLKERENLLKARVKTGKLIFDENGDEVPICPSSTTTFFKIEL